MEGWTSIWKEGPNDSPNTVRMRGCIQRIIKTDLNDLIISWFCAYENKMDKGKNINLINWDNQNGLLIYGYEEIISIIK